MIKKNSTKIFSIESLILTASLFSIVLSFYLTIQEGSVHIPLNNGIRIPETCFIKTTTGINCPTCGLTRCFIAISHGSFGKAAGFNLGGIIAYIYVLFQIPYRIMRILKKGNLSIMQKANYIFTVITGSALLLSWLIYIFSLIL
ncbi:MAG TPA: DUF2752 domain-containing protein [Clostridia bacterium]